MTLTFGGLRSTIANHKSRIFLFLLLPALTGCAILGFVAQAVPKPPVQPRYKGLAGQTVAVIVWVDRAARIDWPQLPLDATASLQQKITPPPKDPPDVLKGTTFPYQPASMVRFTRDHPELEGASAQELAANLNVTRLVYVEVDQFQTRADNAVSLFRGTMVGTVRVVARDPNTAETKVVYEENDVTAHFPPKGPAEGTLDLGDARTYAGTVAAFTTELSHRFVPYSEDE
ncbi:MAG TPA: hypothetical protein VK324_15620 [Tepidisphaeraceae bacterium]|nr:hypothetical protein [Tepidisphaeraceae bacterium]